MKQNGSRKLAVWTSAAKMWRSFKRLKNRNRKKPEISSFSGADGGTWTHTSLRTLAPEASASANSATPANMKFWNLISSNQRGTSTWCWASARLRSKWAAHNLRIWNFETWPRRISEEQAPDAERLPSLALQGFAHDLQIMTRYFYTPQSRRGGWCL